ncbi:MAG TPA: class I SAM-dependent methyltransferase [Acidobacteriaceae bacterium]|nr:class I SAM-dependent methyltransferase [Acidobacteriaceae bacterium]
MIRVFSRKWNFFVHGTGISRPELDRPHQSPGLREILADRYLKGSGIEFGALNYPLSVPQGVTVTYADLQRGESLRQLFSEVGHIREPDIITDIESMRGIRDDSQDFVIANHVLEHVEDPLRALKAINRVLRPTGIAYLTLPDKRFTFDRDRQLTPLSHLLKDHREGPLGSLLVHYEEWCRCVDHLEGDEGSRKIAAMLEQRANIHFHVWDYPEMAIMFAYVARHAEFAFEIEASVLNGIEVIWILRKRSPSSRPELP